MAWIMLNPSTADAEVDDPTIRRCMAFTQRLGWDAMAVVNLFACRATHPEDLEDVADPVGPENGGWIRRACEKSSIRIAAWGALQEPILGGADVIYQLITREYPLQCLGLTKSGQPRHPLYLRADAELRDWTPPVLTRRRA